ncbi:MAG: hypothetical protein B6244_06835 [Candidatus Cloacimonetes bacterium 4572_55]|nr:MAG: hypothetical protein B6244_06835 [Candidatus Cloacimonetes bacterium 4572_55]
MFSDRLFPDLSLNSIALEIDRLQAADVNLINLTESNPTLVGLRYPPNLFNLLNNSDSSRYSPHPLGSKKAREAVAGDYQRRGIAIDSESVILTVGASESYSLLFKLLCDARDTVLIPCPGYPLLEHLCRLDAIIPSTYRLRYYGEWSIDLDEMESAVTDQTRAILSVNPNNPTGSFIKPGEWKRLTAVCRERSLALIVDEVFSDYPLIPNFPSDPQHEGALIFRLGGISKAVGLPQLKLGWIVVTGPSSLREQALKRLEFICDQYLSVNAPIQFALPDIFRIGAAVREQIQERIWINYQSLQQIVDNDPLCNILWTEGGWYAILQAPAMVEEKELTLRALRQAHTLVHPGYFFDFQKQPLVVISLLLPTERFVEGVNRLLSVIEEMTENLNRT